MPEQQANTHKILYFLSRYDFTLQLEKKMLKHDILSDIFSTLRIQGKTYFNTRLKGDFSIEIPKERRHIRFHIIEKGNCWLTVPGFKTVELHTGEVAIVPKGISHTIAKEPQATREPEKLEEIISNYPVVNGELHYGQGDCATNMICGFYHFDEDVDHPVLVNQPDLIVISKREMLVDPGLAATMELLRIESLACDNGSIGMFSRLLEILLIQVMRSSNIALQGQPSGFIGALHDEKLSKAMMAIHQNPAEAWTIENLAKISGMSRARFAEHFTSAVGVTPIKYLTNWRLTKARAMLLNSALSITRIANQCGYLSATSFSIRFKKTYSIGPSEYRRSFKVKYGGLAGDV